jgi:hypothetical protein
MRLQIVFEERFDMSASPTFSISAHIHAERALGFRHARRFLIASD